MESSTSVSSCNSGEVGEVTNFAMDSSRWAGFRYRDGDIVIASWARSGTTWVQQIVAQLLLGPRPDLNLEWLSPWVEHRMTPLPLLLGRLEAQTHRRFVKTHLPADALPFSDKARYLFIGRDGRDIAFSLYNFHKSHTPLTYRLIQAASGSAEAPLKPPGEDFGAYFDEWLDRDGYPWWPFWSHIRSWWSVRMRDNVCLVHYRKLKESLSEEIKRIAAFLEADARQNDLAEIVRLCGFESMKAHSERTFGSFAQRTLAGGMATFFRKGSFQEWCAVLSPEQVAAYEVRAKNELPGECAAWLESGEA